MIKRGSLRSDEATMSSSRRNGVTGLQNVNADISGQECCGGLAEIAPGEVRQSEYCNSRDRCG